MDKVIQRAEARFLRRDEVLARVGLSKTSVYSFIKAGTFPKSIPLGANSVGWLESDIDQWINDRLRAAGRVLEVNEGMITRAKH